MLDRMPRTRKTTNGATGLAKAKRPASTKRPSGVSAEDVAKRAYAIYLSRGGNHGADFDDWLEAERQLKAAAPKSKKRPPSAGPD
jgi:hypothetical protein